MVTVSRSLIISYCSSYYIKNIHMYQSCKKVSSILAISLIDKDVEEFVTFHYTCHEDNKTISECIPAMDFSKRLIIHIPEKHFKMLCYYGIYAKHHKQEKKLRKCISPEKRVFLFRHLDWRNSILLSFGYDPLSCHKCGTSMLALEVYHKKTALFFTI